MRLVQHGDQWETASRLHDANEPVRLLRNDRRATDEDLPGRQGPGDRRLLELRAEQADSTLPAAPETGWRAVPNAAGGCGPRAGVSQVHRMLLVPGRLPRSARPVAQGHVRRSALHDPAGL